VASQQRKDAERSEVVDALARQPGSPNANVAGATAAHADPISEGSDRLAGLYLPPLARLFDLSPRLDELVGGRWLQDPVGWRQEVVSVAQVLRDEKLRLQAIEPAARMAIRTRGGQRRIVIDAAAEFSARTADAYKHDTAVKTQFRKAISIMGERMYIYGTDFTELGLTDGETLILKNHIAEEINKPRSHRNGAGGDSREVSAYVEPIQGLARALQQADVIEVSHELGRVSGYIVERLEQRSAELDAITCRGPALGAAQSRELVRRNFDLTLESKRLPLIDLAIAGILRCFGGSQRLLMELALRENVESKVPTDARIEEILERLADRFMKLNESLRARDE
jgi:hypothetical protein